MDTQWIVTEIDGKVASIATDYRHLPHIGAELPKLPAGVYAVKIGNQGSTLIRL